MFNKSSKFFSNPLSAFTEFPLEDDLILIATFLSPVYVYLPYGLNYSQSVFHIFLSSY
jgi:hypothetical protein